MNPDSPEQRVLRTAREPCTHINDAEVHRTLTADPQAYFRHMLDRLRDIAGGRLTVEMPPKQIFADPDKTSDFRLMPCVVRSPSRAVKTVKLVGTNTLQRQVPDQITVGKALVIDPLENYVTHIVDACLLSSARTGLCAALAVAQLAPRRRHLTVIGCGRVGYYAALYAVANCGIRIVAFADRVPGKAADAAAALHARFPEVDCRIAQMQALPDTDIVVLATTSAQPLCSPPAGHAALVISLGADIDHQSELDPAWAASADIYVDTRDSLRFGDLKAWIAQGRLRDESITDLITLLNHGIPEARRCRLFVSTGSALFDNLTLDYLLNQRG